MNTTDFLNSVYDVLAQNDIDDRHYITHDEITGLIDHVDNERKAIVFKDSKGKEFELQLVQTYAPKEE